MIIIIFEADLFYCFFFPIQVRRSSFNAPKELDEFPGNSEGFNNFVRHHLKFKIDSNHQLFIFILWKFLEI